MPRKLSDLRPCDACCGPVGGTFYVVRHSIAVVNVAAVNEFVGMSQFFQHRAPAALIENFAPETARGFTVAMDEPEFSPLGEELFICPTCYGQPLDLQLISERKRERLARDDERR